MLGAYQRLCGFGKLAALVGGPSQGNTLWPKIEAVTLLAAAGANVLPCDESVQGQRTAVAQGAL